jgi:hypothetical protein
MRGEPYYRAGCVPDTFDYIIHFTATVPITTYILTLQQFAQFDQCGLSCVRGTYTSWSARTGLDATFTGAEGCASYIAVFVAQGNGVMTPKISVKYNPADHLTGACARSG